jgi:hypothetical protein
LGHVTTTAASPRAAEGGFSWLRLPPVVLLLFWTLRFAAPDRPYGFWLDWVNLPFHEAGHLVFMPFGRTLHILGGTLGQLLVPGLLAGYFVVRMRNPYSAALCAWWFGENFVNISVYMADARDLELPLVGGGDHDWNNLFYQFGLLGEESVHRVSSLTHHAGIVLMLAATAWAAFFVLPTVRQEAIRDALSGRFPALRLLFEPDPRV